MNYAIVLAGGIGTRMGANMPKQFLEIGGKPIIAITLEKFSECSEIDGIIVVSVDQEKVCKIIDEYNIKKVMAVVPGGKTRRESSLIGTRKLKELAPNEDNVALVHDAARPFVTEKIILENIEMAKKYGACETAVPIYDTVVRKSDDGNVADFIDREALYRVQTPQSFKLGLLLKAHEFVDTLDEIQMEQITDDAGLVIAIGEKVKIVEGTPQNIKITTPDDIALYLKN